MSPVKYEWVPFWNDGTAWRLEANGRNVGGVAKRSTKGANYWCADIHLRRTGGSLLSAAIIVESMVKKPLK